MYMCSYRLLAVVSGPGKASVSDAQGGAGLPQAGQVGGASGRSRGCVLTAPATLPPRGEKGRRPP